MRAERARRKLDLLSHDEHVIQAARYAHVFGQDVCRVLADEDEDNMLVRLAAAQIIARDERAREEQSRKGMRK